MLMYGCDIFHLCECLRLILNVPAANWASLWLETAHAEAQFNTLHANSNSLFDIYGRLRSAAWLRLKSVSDFYYQLEFYQWQEKAFYCLSKARRDNCVFNDFPLFQTKQIPLRFSGCEWNAPFPISRMP